MPLLCASLSTSGRSGCLHKWQGVGPIVLYNFAFCGSLVDLTASSALLLHICCGLVWCNSSVLAWRENLICAGALQGMQAFALLPLSTSVLSGSQHRLHFLAL